MVNAMRFAAHLRTRLVLAAVCAGLCCAPLAAAAQSGTDMPDAVIPLEPLGYQPAPPIIVVAKGFSVHSLNYVDNKHLLVTWNARTLIHRMPGDPQDDSPQNLQAVLLEAPSGKVVARTVWRLADHAQYLWPVGEGTFLLRVGQQLRVLTPLSPAPDAMQGRLVMTLPGPATLVAIAPDGRMVLVESDVAKAETKTPVALPGAAPVDTQATDVQFLEFDLARQAQGIVNVNRVGHLISPSLLALPLTHEGYIHATEISPDDWDLIYTELSGKDKGSGGCGEHLPAGRRLSEQQRSPGGDLQRRRHRCDHDRGDAGQEGAVAVHAERCRHRPEHTDDSGLGTLCRQPHPDRRREFAGRGGDRTGGCAQAAH